MKQLEFENHYREFWQHMENLLDDKDDIDASLIERFPADYRRLCQHLAVAKSRRYAPGLTNRLNYLVQRGYQKLYGQRVKDQGILVEYFVRGFPAALRLSLIHI